MSDLHLLSPELLAAATPAELAEYEQALIRQQALLSPLDYAMYVSDGRVKPYPHTELLSRYARALTEHAIYDSGIGPPAVFTVAEGAEDEHDGKWLHPETGEEAHNILVVSAPPQFGKQVKDHELVWTTEGLKKHGDIKVGDYVYHPSGRPVRVLAVTDPSFDATMRVTFFDGSHVDVHPNHEWTLYNRNLRRFVTVETKSLEGTYERALWQLPHHEALQNPHRDLPIDPYSLGAWLGDGATDKAVICGAESDLNHIMSQVPYEFGYHAIHKDTGVHYRGLRGFLVRLRRAGVLGNKHIPEEYQLASEQQRRRLMQGLVDTDGHWSPTGKQVVVTTVSRSLAQDIRTLARSLGYRAGINTSVDKRQYRAIKSNREMYHITWSPHDEQGGGSLPRKRPSPCLRRRIGVRSVEAIPDDAWGRCIQVDSPDGLYLVTEALIPTHNSLILTETTPAWYLTRYPHNRVIVTGYEADFAKGFGRKNRDKIEEHPELGISVSTSTRAADEWEIANCDGGLVTAGAGGAITGRRADFILIDDPVKNSEEALSETSRRKNKEWWQSTIKSRMRTNTVCLIVQTRWHEDDLAGHVTGTERCFTLNLPALAFETEDPAGTGYAYDEETEQVDPLHRRPGQSLCPALQTRAMLLKKMQTGDGDDEPGGMLWFSALYQGKPNIQGGGVLPQPYRYYTVEKNFAGREYYRCECRLTSRVHKVFTDECIYFAICDLAATTKTTADWTVYGLFAWNTESNLLILVDLLRLRVESSEHVQVTQRFWNNARRLTGRQGIRFLGVESKTFGLTLIQNLRSTTRIPVRSLEADGDKTARALPVGIAIRQDEFFIPRKAEYLRDLEKEMASFPKGRHDDQVDVLAYALKASETLPHNRKTDELQSIPAQVREQKKRRKYHPVAGRVW